MTPQTPEEIQLTIIGQNQLLAGDGPCDLFLEGFGNVSTPEQVSALTGDLRELVQDVAGSAVRYAPERFLSWADQQSPSPLDIVKGKLGCYGCSIVEVCPIKEELDKSIEQQKAERILTMVADSPVWLLGALLHINGLAPEEFFDIITKALQSEDSAAVFQEAGIDIASLHAGIDRERMSDLPSDDLPSNLEAALTATKKVKSFETYAINFTNSPDCTIAVSDLSEVNGFDGTVPGPKPLGILFVKFLKVLQGIDKDGNLPDLSDDMMKIVRDFGNGGKILEVRMAGKNRLYCASFVLYAEKDKNGRPIYRILLLGTHGGDAATQEKFYRRIGLSNLD